MPMCDDYEKEVFGSLGGSMVSNMELAYLLDFLKPKPSERILDIGTGTGRIARVLVNCNADLTGIDMSLIRLKTSIHNRILLSKNGANYPLALADGQFLPFRDSYFDSIVCVRVLKYFPNYSLGIKEISRVLKPGGRLVLSVSNSYGIDLVLVKLGLLAYKNLFSISALRPVFSMNGLTLKKTLPLNKIHPKLWSFIGNKSFLNFLYATELTLKKTTPQAFLSREILLQLVKRKK